MLQAPLLFGLPPSHFQVLLSCLVAIIARAGWLLLTRSVVPDCFKYNLTSGRLRGDWIKLLGYLRQIFSQFLHSPVSPVTVKVDLWSWSCVFNLSPLKELGPELEFPKTDTFLYSEYTSVPIFYRYP